MHLLSVQIAAAVPTLAADCLECMTKDALLSADDSICWRHKAGANLDAVGLTVNLCLQLLNLAMLLAQLAPQVRQLRVSGLKLAVLCLQVSL